MASSPRRREVGFDPPLNLNSYLPIVSFPSRFVVAKKGVHCMQSFGDKSPTRKGKKVWVEAPIEENREEEVKQEVVLLGNLSIKHDGLCMFSVTYLIGTRKLKHAMLDLRLAINIMFVHIYYKQSHILHSADI